MIKIYYLFIFLFSFVTFAQNANTPETIEQELERAKILSTKDAQQAISLCSTLFDESKKIDFEAGMLKSKETLATLYFNTGQYEKVIKISSEVETLALKKNDYETLAIIYRQVAASYSMLRLNNEALKMLDKAKTYAGKIEDKNKRYYTTALIYDSYTVCAGQANEDVDQYIYYVEKSLEELKKYQITPQKKI